MCNVINEKICLTFCVCVEIVFRAASSIRRAGLIAIAAVRENYLDFADAETYGLLKID